MTSQQFRKLRDQFWQSKQHIFLPEANIITPIQDTTTLFNQSGMQQLIPYLAGKPHKLGQRLHNIQKCIRTNDIDEVGDRTHLTFFEMMGNRSLGDYFKKESIARSREFLTEVCKLDSKKLSVTVFGGNTDAPRDETSIKNRKKLWIPDHKIAIMTDDDEDNCRRSPGPVWPCGPDSEVHYWIGDRRWGEKLPSEHSNAQTDEDNWMEIRNNVFMEFYRDETGYLTKLKSQNVDTGMGFERLCIILQNKDTIYETDLFAPIISTIEKYTDLKYTDNQKRMRIIADHLRSSSIIIQDGGIASNTGAGYILRMLIRRMYYNTILLKEMTQKEFSKFLKDLIQLLADLNPHRDFDTKSLYQNLTNEIENFKKTISKGLKILNTKLKNKKFLSGKDAFTLYDTYGFPIELTKEICTSKEVEVDLKWFEQEMVKAKDRSRQATKDFFDKGIDWSKYLEWISETIFVWYDLEKASDAKLLKDFEVDGQRILIFDKTPFYAESGGQTWDSWGIVLDSDEEVKIQDVKKYEGVFLHFVG